MQQKPGWMMKLDWVNILSILNLSSKSSIPQKNIETLIVIFNYNYSEEKLEKFDPGDLDELVAFYLEFINDIDEKSLKEIYKWFRNQTLIDSIPPM